jgi:hypothetical protein
MSNNHLKTAHEYGIQKALEAVGYKSAEEVRRDAEALGLIEAPKTAAANPLADLFRAIQK